MADNAQLTQRARDLLLNNAKLAVRAPDFGADRAWLNVARPLTLERDLRGKLVLVDFWTYSSIHCTHVLADLKELERKYAGEPFVVVGCHAAKFRNESDEARVREAVLREEVEHPVLVDRDFEIWRRFNIRAWPTLLLISPEGTLLGQVTGEGQRAVLEALIDQALAYYRAKPGAFDARALPIQLERDAELARELRFPAKVLVRRETRELLIADTGHDRIVVATLEGAFVRVIGSGVRGLADGEFAQARFARPRGMALRGNELFVADTDNHAIRLVDLGRGVVSTIAGTGKQGYERVGRFPASQAALNSPWDVALRGDELWIAMAGHHQLWRLDLATRMIEAGFGDGSERRLDGAAATSAFAQPSGIALSGDVLYVADAESSSIRAVDVGQGKVATLVGGHSAPENLFNSGDADGIGLGPRFQHPLAVLAHDGMLYVADAYNHKVKFVDPATGRATTYAGDGEPGSADGTVDEVNFREPSGLAAFDKWLFVADANNHAIRAIDLEQHDVRTLSIADAPIPRERLRGGARSIDGSPLPLLPGTVDHGVVAAKLRSGNAAIELAIELRQGETLAAGAPSQYRVLHDFGLTAAKSIAGAISGPRTRIELGVEGAGRLFVQALCYVAAADGECRRRSARWTLEVTPASDGLDVVTLAAR